MLEIVYFSDLDDDSYQLRNFNASDRKEMFPGWELALPPRPQITSLGVRSAVQWVE